MFNIKDSVLTGSWYIDIAIIVCIALMFWIGVFKIMRPEMKELQGGYFIYIDHVGNTRNLGPYFDKIRPDMVDYISENPNTIYPPYAAIFHGDTNLLTTPND